MLAETMNRRRMATNYFCLLVAPVLILIGCKNSRQSAEQRREGGKIEIDLSMDNLFAWCVVPFDSVDRSPQERVNMLKELGFTSYAYDWREKHLANMEEEWDLARKSKLDVMAVWLWIDNNYDRPGKLNGSNEQVLKAIAKSKLKTQIWVGFNSNYFQDLSDEDKIKRGVEMVNYLHSRAESVGCKLALYNHGDWFGEPANQVKIIEAIDGNDIGIVFNFHHAHGQIDRFQSIVDVMLPHLWAVNLNGLSKSGPKILPIGDGDHERSMLRILHDSGYAGPYGVLGHVEDADVREILMTNLAGLQKLEL